MPKRKKAQINIVENTYSISVIKRAWKIYRKEVVLLVLKNGKWKIDKSTEGAIKAKISSYDKIMQFPEFLSVYYKTEKNGKPIYKESK